MLFEIKEKVYLGGNFFFIQIKNLNTEKKYLNLIFIIIHNNDQIT